MKTIATITIDKKTEDVMALDLPLKIKAISKDAKNFVNKTEGEILLRQKRKIVINGRPFDVLLVSLDFKFMEWFLDKKDFVVVE